MKLQNFDISFEYWDNGTTLCRVADKEKVVIGEATIKKYHKDKPWDKEHLKKEIMKRALAAANISKEERSKIWEEYRTSTKTPRW